MSEHYAMLIEWSEEDHLYIVSLPEWGPFATTHGSTYEEAVHMGQEALALLISSAKEAGEALPRPRRFAIHQVPA